MIPAVFLIIIAHGLPQFVMPMRSIDVCMANGQQLGAMMDPKAEVHIGCFDAMAQAFVMAPGQLHPLQPAAPKDHEKID